jgi:hypothetical protein
VVRCNEKEQTNMDLVSQLQEWQQKYQDQQEYF